jgi:hypothetical protein
LVQTSDGGYALAGYTRSFGEGFFSDFYLVKTDSDGVVQWNTTYGGKSGDDQANSLIQTRDGGYALVGETLSSLGAGGVDMYLVKTDASGKMLWNKTYGGTEDDGAWSLVQTSDNGYALAGYTESFGAGGKDAYLVKTDADGKMLWSKTYGGAGAEEAASLVRTTDGGYALAGYTLFLSAGALDADVYLVKTDPSGKMLWNKTYGGTGAEVAASVVQMADGGYALAGYTLSFGAGKADVYVVRTEGESGLDWISSNVNSITLVRDAFTLWSSVRVQIWRKR